jgi:hypothetical protein
VKCFRRQGIAAANLRSAAENRQGTAKHSAVPAGVTEPNQKSDRWLAGRRRQRAEHAQHRKGKTDNPECQHDNLLVDAAEEFPQFSSR